jgi:CDP-glucose 4,6-dehydratase
MTFWKNKRVLVTGNTGFKGSWLSIWLTKLGARVHGYALPPITNPALFTEAGISAIVRTSFSDIRNLDGIQNCLYDFRPEIIFHLAAQPVVSVAYDDPIENYDINVMGTVKLLDAIRRCDFVRTVVNVTTDKCYKNKEWTWPYRETDELGGLDPYSNSKSCSELVTESYCHSFLNMEKISVATARAGNVIGGGDWTINRLIPDVLRSANLELAIRSPDAVRPWQHVLEPIHGYMLLAEKMFKGDITGFTNWNFGPNLDDCKSVRWILDYINKNHQNIKCHYNSSVFLESKTLKLDNSKAKELLHWAPVLDILQSIDLTFDWYKKYYSQRNAFEISMNQIQMYEDLIGSES